MSNLKANVAEYVKICEFLEVTASIRRDKTKRKKELEPLIMEGIKNDPNAGDGWEVEGRGTIVLNTRTRRGGMNKKFLESELSTIMGCSTEQGKEHARELYDRRPAEEVEEIKFKMDPATKQTTMEGYITANNN